jgi:acyl-CoA thioester hydrolase
LRLREIRPPAALASAVRHRVPFYETDAMGIVHHANYVNYLELARVAWMDEHDRPYREYVAEGLHFATTHVELDYRRSAAFDDVIEISTWMEWVRGASLRMAYSVHRGQEILAVGATEHALVDLDGRPRRIPKERRERLAKQALGAA